MKRFSKIILGSAAAFMMAANVSAGAVCMNSVTANLNTYLPAIKEIAACGSNKDCLGLIKEILNKSCAGSGCNNNLTEVLNKLQTASKASCNQNTQCQNRNCNQNIQCQSDSCKKNAQKTDANCNGSGCTQNVGKTEKNTNTDNSNQQQKTTTAQQTDSSLSAYINKVVELVNKERAAQGLSAVTVDTKLQQAAQVRAKEQATQFSHTRPNGTRCFTVLSEYGISYNGAGENVAMGQTSAEQVMQDWMNSSGHRANIMNAKYTKIGVGCYKGANGRMYWSQLFIY